MYKDKLLEHYRSARNTQPLDNPSAFCQLLNPSCGDHVALQLDVADTIIVAVGMQARGCVVCVACASLLSEALKGLTLDQAKKIDLIYMERLTGLALGPIRQNCMMLPVNALHKALECK